MSSINKVDVKWLDDLCFEAEIQGHKILMDSGGNPDKESRGASPKPFMLSALGGCAGMDIISILKKMKVNIDYFNISVTGFLTEEYPKHYDKIHLIFEFKGKNLSIDKINQAIKLSEEKYCGVWTVYKQTMEITKEVKLLK
jgi:putative redox protein